MHFTTSVVRLITTFLLVSSVTAAPVTTTSTSSTGLSAGEEGGASAGGSARFAARDLSSSSARSAPVVVDADIGIAPPATLAEQKKREFSRTMFALKDRLLMKRQPEAKPEAQPVAKADAAPEPKRFSLDDFTTIAAANDKYDGLRPEGSGYVGLKQRGLPGWSRIY